MTKTILLILAFFAFQHSVFAAGPTVPSSNINFSGIDGSQFSINYTVGNGATRLIVMKQGSPVVGMPVNGVDYTPNSAFGTAGSQFTAPGEYVVAKTSWNAYSVSNLQPGTTYYVAIFEYNGSGVSTQYLAVPLTGSQQTSVAPTIQTTSIVASGITGNAVTLNWTKGNGAGRIILARKGSAVNVVPADLTNYFSDANFGNGNVVGGGNFVVYKGTGTSLTVRNLEPNTLYHFSFFEYNGNSAPIHLLPGATAFLTTTAGPSVAPSSAGFSFVEGNRMLIAVSPGNGTRRLFIARKNSAVTATPVNGINYTASAAFGTAGTEIAPGEFVVSAGTASSVNVTALEPNTIYHFRVFEYDADATNNNYYLVSSFATKSGSTSITPTAVASNLNTISITGSSATIGFTNGNGAYRTVVMKAGSAVDAAPVNLQTYASNSNFGQGATLSPGNFIIHSGMNGSQFTVTNLVPGTTYHVAIYESNGNAYPVYSTSAATYNFTVPLEPTGPSTAPWTAFVEGGSFRLIWTNGNGGKRIVIARKNIPVTTVPADASNYIANGSFGSGDALSADEFVVYNGNANSVDLTNLQPSTTYHFAVFEYNVSQGGTADYLTSAKLVTTGATVSAPTTPLTISGTSSLLATSANVNFAKGNGGSRIFIMKQGSAVTSVPQDLIKYNYNPSFGSAGSLVNNGNYAIMITSGNGSFAVSNLQPNTTYYVSGFEFNGANEPVYLQAGAGSFNFTTPDVAGATIPTIAASLPMTTSVDGNKFTFKWTNGNGEKRIVVMHPGSPVNFMPASATIYSANAAFGAGTDLGNGQYAVYNGSGSSVDITNLQPSTTYYLTVFEYNGSGSLLRYLTGSVLATNAATVAAPTVSTGNVNAVGSNGQVTLTWNSGNGAGRLIVMKESSAVPAVPSDLGLYPGNAVFGNGAQVATGEYVVYAGSGNSVTVTGLSNKTYHYRVFEYNGASAPVYNVVSFASGSFVAGSILPVKLTYFRAEKQQEKVLLTWATSQEQHADRFEIERSADAQHYNFIGVVAAAGNSADAKNYVFADMHPLAEKAYYRLKMVDVDGTATYSIVAVVTGNVTVDLLSVYPNPVQNSFRIHLGLSGAALLTIYNEAGALILKKQVRDGEIVDSAKWPGGIYYAGVKMGGQMKTISLRK